MLFKILSKNLVIELQNTNERFPPTNVSKIKTFFSIKGNFHFLDSHNHFCFVYFTDLECSWQL